MYLRLCRELLGAHDLSGFHTGRGMKQLDIQRIAAYSPEARGRSQRAFATHPGRLPQELVLAGMIEMDAANAYLQDRYRLAFNAEFSHPPRKEGTAFVPSKTPNPDCRRGADRGWVSLREIHGTGATLWQLIAADGRWFGGFHRRGSPPGC